MKYHPYHLVTRSPWPIYAAISTIVIALGLACWFHNHKHVALPIYVGLFMLITSMCLWWRDVIREGTFWGEHTIIVQKGLKIGMVWFIISEAMLFFGIFWAYYHAGLSPAIELGAIWPPIGVAGMNPWTVPLLNTVILLTSGGTVTYAHHLIRSKGIYWEVIVALAMTVLLGIIFTILQGYEYYEGSYTIADSVFGSIFYMGTGVHGIHVIIGTIFLLVSFYRGGKYHYSDRHHVGLEASVMYWHFVDYMWLVLYVSMYVWTW